jgi:hypothetical protein
MTISTKTFNLTDLNCFTGTESFHRHHLVREIIFTDAVHYIAEHGGAWLIDKIAINHKFIQSLRDHPFQVWSFDVDDNRSGVLDCQDGDEKSLFSEHIPITDFPAGKVEFYIIDGTFMLSSEY